MRFMYIVTGKMLQPPSPALMEAIGKISEREIKAGRMIDNGGLTPMEEGARISIAAGKLSVTDGPFVETKEIIGGYAIFELRDKAEALAMAAKQRSAKSIARAIAEREAEIDQRAQREAQQR